MALFVAKLLTPEAGTFADPRKGEPFQLKLARTLKQRRLFDREGVSDEFKVRLSKILSQPPTNQTKSGSWPSGVVDLISSISIQPHSDMETVIGQSISELSSRLHAAEREKTFLEDKAGLQREILVAEAVHALSKTQHEKSVVDNITNDIREIEAEIKRNQVIIDKGRFLETLVLCIGLTDELRAVPVSAMVEFGDMYFSKLAEVEILRPCLFGRCREVIDSRFAVLMDGFTGQLVKALESEDGDRKSAYKLLSRFENPDPFRAIALFLKTKLIKFNYHFVRQASALNLVDKPEWPLRWFIDTAVETANLLDERDHVGAFLARKAREYFRDHRWSLIKNSRDHDDSELFSLFLAKYIHSANQWKDVFGKAVLSEFMSDFTENIPVREWRLLDAWIAHDLGHIQNAVEATSSPFAPSRHNPKLCNIVQTIEDVFRSSQSRLECITWDPKVLAVFVGECHDLILEDFIYRVRVESRELQGSETELIRNSLSVLIGFVELTRLASADVVRQLAELIRHI